MTRGRPRKGLSRMDAAVDAMNKFGFEKNLVRKHVKELLGEYGGDVGWPFIEDCSYKELLDAILREQEMVNLENVAGDGDQIEEECGLNEELAGPSNIASDTDNDQESPRKEHSPTISTEIPPRPPTIRRCLHFYGWIDRYEEEDDNFITLQPSSMVLGPPKAAMLGKCLNGETRKRRSRWDQRPGDP